MVLNSAILHNYKRNRVKDAQYPAIVESPGSTTEGILIEGLSIFDLKHMDYYEGLEFNRVRVQVEKLGPIKVKDNFEQILTKCEGKGEIVSTECYIWVDSPDRLIDQDWDLGCLELDYTL
ncbi:hypothetical protein CANARDRAFT_27283 [[Candida] arabinofermentans NRRL YB-2248]|uniref:Putative gamma-glutamylcyclotransferase n=1 Tax=[Candida] arabinofermentans NRRL YB-2248 TaxID=983967 RepID=A0A1E4T5D5_9ASCO|nr:hypothetical protein CANARDRAFT_27283 [[Candida] arabinofermentans NRRL YB-2248]